MNWKLWQKKNPLSEASPWEVAGLPLALLLDREKPFSSWHPDNCEIRPELRNWLQPMVWIYQIHTYLELLEAKFGPEISALIQEYMRIVSNHLKT